MYAWLPVRSRRCAANVLALGGRPSISYGIDPPASMSGVNASIGIALAPEQGRDLERLLQLADLAMYDAKLKGKNRFAFAQDAGVPNKIRTLVPRVSRSS